jgi:hypothetical protein
MLLAIIHTVYSMNNSKFINARQAKEIYQYKNIKEKLHKINAAIWYKKICKLQQLTPKYILIKVNGHKKQKRYE